MCSSLPEPTADVPASPLRSRQVEPSTGKFSLCSGRAGHGGNSSLLREHYSSECLWKGSGPLALIRPILPWNVSGSTSPRPSPQRQRVWFFTLIFSIPLLYFLLDLFSLSPPPTWSLFMVSLSPAADCCTSNLCSRLGMFFTLFNSLPVSAPPVSPLVH